MPKSKTLPLVAAMTLLFVFTIAACTSEKKNDLPPFPDLSSFDTESAMADPGPIAFGTSYGVFDDSELTVEQILNRTRLAMSDIVSYKSRGTLRFRSSTSGFEEPTLESSERDSNGNYRSRSSYPQPYDDDVHPSEFRTVGTQMFNFYSHEGWKESSELRSKPRSIFSADRFLSAFEQNDTELRSTNERTEDGTEVYRLVFSERYELPVRDGEYFIGVWTSTLLVSKESFRVIATLKDSHGERYAVSSASEIGADTHSRWVEYFAITEYYDFNEPIVIEVPDQYTPSPGTVMLRR